MRLLADALLRSFSVSVILTRLYEKSSDGYLQFFKVEDLIKREETSYLQRELSEKRSLPSHKG